MRAPRPTPALIVALLALVVTLGGSAFAASKIGSGGVKNGSVKSADFKDNAGVKGADVTDGSLGSADVRDGSLASADVADESVGGADVNDASLAASRVVASLGGSSGAAVPGVAAPVAVPNLGYTQAAGRSDEYIAGGQVTFGAACGPTRQAVVYLLLDGLVLGADTVVGFGAVSDGGTGARSRRFNIASAPGTRGTSSFRSAAGPHQFVVYAGGTCGSGAGITLDSVTIDVIGHG